MYAVDPPDPDAEEWLFSGVVTVNLDTGAEQIPTGWTTTVTRDDAEAEAQDPGWPFPPEPLAHRAFRTASRRLAVDWTAAVSGLL